MSEPNLELIIEKLREENTKLKNRCHTLTLGTFCIVCPYECGHRKVEFRGGEPCADQSPSQ